MTLFFEHDLSVHAMSIPTLLGDHREPEPSDAAGAQGSGRSAHLGGRKGRFGVQRPFVGGRNG